MHCAVCIPSGLWAYDLVHLTCMLDSFNISRYELKHYNGLRKWKCIIIRVHLTSLLTIIVSITQCMLRSTRKNIFYKNSRLLIARKHRFVSSWLFILVINKTKRLRIYCNVAFSRRTYLYYLSVKFYVSHSVFSFQLMHFTAHNR